MCDSKKGQISMQERELLALYDQTMAHSYEAKYIHALQCVPEVEFEISMIKSLLRPKCRWLDVACGTGFFLSRFPKVERAGLDLSPAMLAEAKKANPDIPLIKGTYLEERPDWVDHWDLVTCMWFAYGYVETIRDIDRLIANLAAWTAPQGVCFLPYCDLEALCTVAIPHLPMTVFPGRVRISSVIWSYDEDTGKIHENMLAPCAEYLIEVFARYFRTVQQIEYPSPEPGKGRRAIVARDKRTQKSGPA